MNDNMFYTLKTVIKTGKLVDEDEESKKAEFEKLKVHYNTGRDESYKNLAGDKVHKYRHGMMTDIGDIVIDNWIKMANELIDKYNERDIYEELLKYSPFKNKKDCVINALEMHMARMFENTEWVSYEKFKTSFFDKRNRC